jgi:hypothetical protein
MAQTKTKPKSKPKASSKRRSSSSRKPSSSGKQANSSKSSPTAAVTQAADKATTAVGHAADKAKIPLVAGGAALAGVAGGAMLGARQARRSNHPNLAKAAKNVGTFGAQVGRLASEIHQARESGNGKHRSPVEVVLEGLTTRRSRS